MKKRRLIDRFDFGCQESLEVGVKLGEGGLVFLELHLKCEVFAVIFLAAPPLGPRNVVADTNLCESATF